MEYGVVEYVDGTYRVRYAALDSSTQGWTCHPVHAWTPVVVGRRTMGGKRAQVASYCAAGCQAKPKAAVETSVDVDNRILRTT
jgi:hypothetical protein